MSLELSLWLGMAFGALAAAMAFLIDLEAYRRHQLPAQRQWREALTAAAFAFAVFLAFALATGYALGWLI